MKEIPFSIPVSGVIKIDEGNIRITVNSAETIIKFEDESEGRGRGYREEGKTLFDVVLEAAVDCVREKGSNRFRSAELYHRALERYPELKRNSFASHVIACAPNHSSYKHYTAKRDYFSYSSDGLYRLTDEYVEEKTSDEERILHNR